MRKLLLIGFRKDRHSMFLQQLNGVENLCTVVIEEQDLKELLQNPQETLL